jgi:hypothetical protein
VPCKFKPFHGGIVVSVLMKKRPPDSLIELPDGVSDVPRGRGIRGMVARGSVSNGEMEIGPGDIVIIATKHSGTQLDDEHLYVPVEDIVAIEE